MSRMYMVKTIGCFMLVTSIVAITSFLGCNDEESMNIAVITKSPIDQPVGPIMSCEIDTCEEGQVCTGADCCDPADACGDACCASDDTCFAGQCVTPGAVCVLGDCDEGSYCEMALSEDAVIGDPSADQTCQAGTSVPKGRCLTLPTTCSADASDSADCVHEACEFKPTDSPLRTKLLWSWGSDYVIPELPDESHFTAPEPKMVDGESNPKFVKPTTVPDSMDVWSTAVVGRVTDTNCDGKVDNNDTPNIVVVSGDNNGTGCQGKCGEGVIRVLDGKSGRDLVTILPADSGSTDVIGFAGVTPVLANVDNVPGLDIIAVDSDGHINVFGAATGKTLLARSSGRIDSAWQSATNRNTFFGWGGYLSVGSDDADDHLLIAFDGDIFVLKRATGSVVASIDKINNGPLSFDARTSKSGAYFADVDPDYDGLELIAHGNMFAFDTNAAGDIVAQSIWDGKLLDVGAGDVWNDGVDRSIDYADYAFNTNPPPAGEGPVSEQIARFFYSGVADFDGDDKPEIVAVFAGYVFVFDAKTRVLRAPPHRIEFPDIFDRDSSAKGIGRGGSITIANMKDFADDPSVNGVTFKVPEVGIALQHAYVSLRIQLDPSEQNVTTGTISMNWATPTFDTSSSQTGSTVFDFEGNGIAEVVYNDECYQWVFDGRDGSVKFAMPTESFTGTESSIVADVNGDGHAEMVTVSNGASHISSKCQAEAATSDGIRPGWFDSTGTSGSVHHRGVKVFGDISNRWVGTRQLWNQHAYSVTNVCDGRDVADMENATCDANENVYGNIPSSQITNWTQKTRAGEGDVPFLNNFRQNIQGEGRFDAADAAVGLRFQCDSDLTAVVTVQNKGRNILPAGVRVGIFLATDSGAPTGKKLVAVSTTSKLFSGQSTDVRADLSGDQTKRYVAKLLLNSDDPLFVECQAGPSKQAAIDNNISEVTTVGCITGSRLR